MDLDVARIEHAVQVIDPVFLNPRSTSTSSCAGRWATAR
jgi:hypothetical protein